MQRLVYAAKDIRNDPAAVLGLVGDALQIGSGTLDKLSALPTVTAVLGDLQGAAVFSAQAGQAAYQLGSAVASLREGAQSDSPLGWLDAAVNAVDSASASLQDGAAAVETLTGWLAVRRDK
ncbi:hypothetical protein [Neisseria sp. S1]|uniref:hypothetical protein n=1 Tax=Neisseria sp. S1 TaxID=3318354 RepID=UPI003A8B7744